VLVAITTGHGNCGGSLLSVIALRIIRNRFKLDRAPLEILPYKQPPTGNNRQIGEQQTKGHARHEAERLEPIALR